MKSNLKLNDNLINSINTLETQEKSPFYLYDTQLIQQNCYKMLDVPYVHKSVHFAMMANSTPQFIEIIKQAGLNVFVNSILHMDIATELGYNGEDIVFAASAMDEDTMIKVQGRGALVILDSIGQFEKWTSLFPDTGVGIRCNIGELVSPRKTLAGYFIGKESRLGFTIDEINQLKGNKNIIGLHTYVGTNITDINYFLDCYNQIANLAELFPELRFLDFGGGFGISEESSIDPINIGFDMVTYGKRVAELMTNVSNKLGRKIKLILEPGRIIGGKAGYFICKVVDIKKRDEIRLIGVNASSVQFPRPLFYPDDVFHPVAILSNNKLVNSSIVTKSTIYGCSTYSRDFFVNNIQLPEVKEHDTIVLGYAGSYCATAHTSFLGFPKAKEFFL